MPRNTQASTQPEATEPEATEPEAAEPEGGFFFKRIVGKDGKAGHPYMTHRCTRTGEMVRMTGPEATANDLKVAAIEAAVKADG